MAMVVRRIPTHLRAHGSPATTPPARSRLPPVRPLPGRPGALLHPGAVHPPRRAPRIRRLAPRPRSPRDRPTRTHGKGAGPRPEAGAADRRLPASLANRRIERAHRRAQAPPEIVTPGCFDGSFPYRGVATLENGAWSARRAPPALLLEARRRRR